MFEQSLDKLIIKKQYRAHPTPAQFIQTYGYDTETIGGKCALIACSDGRFCHPTSFDDIVNILCCKKTQQTSGFFYNLKYDFQAILKWLPEALWLEIFRTGEIEVLLSNNKSCRIFYIPSKFLKIRFLDKKGKAKHTYSFFDMAQYYGKQSLNTASKKYLNESKLEHNFDLANLTIEQLKTQQAIDYCIKDALLVKKLADRWIAICHQNDLYPSNFSSTASISARYFNERVEIPTINRFLKTEFRRELLQYPWNACAGAFISVFKRGYFDNIHCYDINSAYPFQMSQLPDIEQGSFFKSKKILPEAKLGWMKAKINIERSSSGAYHPCLPILRKNLSNYYPVGNFETFITLLEYNELKHYFDVEIKDGLYWIPSEEHYLFKNIINDIYTRRKTTTDDNINYFLKIILNSIYGKFLERHQILDDEQLRGYCETGNYFNPFYASYILAGTRVQIFKTLLLLKEDDIVAVFTDSILTKKQLSITVSNQLGSWSYEGAGEAVIVGCGVYTIKQKEKIKTKIRGFHTTSKIDLFDIIKNQKNKKSLTIDIKINISPLTSIIQKRIVDMNLIIDDKKCVDINFDTKRLWLRSFKSAKELLEKEINSEPIFYGLI